MRLRVLGCHGGESTMHRNTCFLVDDTMLLDAGAVTRGLPVSEQAKIDSVILSHSHLDHIRDLPLLADNVIGVRKKPVDIYCTGPTQNALKKHIFNNQIWPDFTQIPNPADPDNPTIRIHKIDSGKSFRVGPYEVRTIKVQHPVDSQAIFVTSKGKTLVFVGDTGPTDKLWRELNKLEDLKALLFEVSFPNHMQKLAEVSGHFTPEMLQEELKKFDPKKPVRIHLFHLKPGFHDVLKAQVAALDDPRLVILKPMDEIEF